MSEKNIIEKPKRKIIDWHNAIYKTCSCGKHAAVMEGMCAECHDENYNYELESAYISRIKELELQLSAVQATP